MQKILIKRTNTPNSPPIGLDAGELAVEMNVPTRLWVGVPVSIDPSGKKLLLEVGSAGAKFVDVTGDTMTGPLILHADPAVDLQAATKQYVDNVVTVLTPVINGKVAKAGDAMTGPLVLSAAPTSPLHAATKKYADDAIGSGGPPNTGLPAGSVMVFYQAAAPTGFTKLVTHNDKTLRVVSGAGGVAGGTNSFSTVMAQTVTGSLTPSISFMGSHYHTHLEAAWPRGYPGGTYWGGDPAGQLASSSVGSGSVHNHSLLMAIQYLDVILASKN
jgi:hypothetical protein